MDTMNVVQMYTVLDTKASAFLTPFFCENEMVVRRMLAYVCNQDKEHGFYRFPEDYVIFHCGSFDRLTGEITAPEKGSSVVCKMIELVERME